MKNYEDMSDFEINKAVALIVGVTFNDDGAPVRFVECDTGSYGDFNEIEFDPCANPADAWPIIEKYRISIINLDEDEWGARGVAYCKSKRAIHENPLRAAMIVFLKMNEDKL